MGLRLGSEAKVRLKNIVWVDDGGIGNWEYEYTTLYDDDVDP